MSSANHLAWSKINNDELLKRKKVRISKNVRYDYSKITTLPNLLFPSPCLRIVLRNYFYVCDDHGLLRLCLHRISQWERLHNEEIYCETMITDGNAIFFISSGELIKRYDPSTEDFTYMGKSLHTRICLDFTTAVVDNKIFTIEGCVSSCH